MSRFNRVKNIIIGLLMLAFALVLALVTDDGYLIVTWTLSGMLILYGLNKLVYFVMMARHMVGGRIILYEGVIITDLGVFMLTLASIPKMYVMLYLLVVHAFNGVIDLLRAFEAKRVGAPSWKVKFALGAFNIAVAITCVVFIRSTQIAVYIFAAGLVPPALIRISSAFRGRSVIRID